MQNTIEAPGIVSGTLTENAILAAGPGILRDLVINSDGTNNVKVQFYDNAEEGSGTVVWEGTCVGANNTLPAYPNRHFSNGLYAKITNSGQGAGSYNVSILKE
jgi:hypothetical protein